MSWFCKAAPVRRKSLKRLSVLGFYCVVVWATSSVLQHHSVTVVEESLCDNCETLFATSALTHGGRWDGVSVRRALRLMYSSLYRAHQKAVKLVVYTDDPREVQISNTTWGAKVNLFYQKIDVETLSKFSVYEDPWHAISRSKLNEVEALMLRCRKRVIWIDLDTLVFVNLERTFEFANSWVVGFHHGDCRRLKRCSKLGIEIPSEFDIQGDLWSLDFQEIDEIRKLEREMTMTGQDLPVYDVQGYLSILLTQNKISPKLLHRILPFNFGFACSDFHHPSEINLELMSDSSSVYLLCPLHDGVDMPMEVGSMSFTAPTFTHLFLGSDQPNFSFIKSESVVLWFLCWFYFEACDKK